MGKRFASWLTGAPGRAVFATGVFGLLPLLGLGIFAFLPGAVPALVALQRGTRAGLQVALAASALLAAAMWFGGRPLPVGLTYAAWLLAPPLLLAVLLARTQSLSLCLQVTALAGAAVLVLLHASLGDPLQFSAAFVRDLAAEMQGRRWPVEFDADALVTMFVRSLWFWIALLTMLLGALSLFLARWWQSQLAAAPGGFGEEFRALRLGRVLGLVAAVLMVAALFSPPQLVDDLAKLFVCALVVVGLAAAHRAKAAGRLSGASLWVIYLVLVLLTPIAALALAGWGFADNWLRSRPDVGRQGVA
jgi:hypothetical protein